MPKQMLDLDRDVVADSGVLRGKSLYHPCRVSRTVEEIRIAERDVRRTGRHLGSHVGHHHIDGHDPELALVHRHDRTVAAEVFAPPRRLSGTAHPSGAVGHLDARVGLERRQTGPIGLNEAQLRDPTTARLPIETLKHAACGP